MANALDRRLTEDVEDAVRRIVSAEHHASGSFVRLPLSYPSGANVVVQVSPQGAARCFLTDLGFGFQEAEMIGAGNLYHSQAIAVANDAGVRYDGNAMFVAEVPRERLVGAITIIGNCSSRAAALAAMKLSEQKERKGNQQLYERLVNIFTKARVAREAEIIGASNHKWKASNLVTLRRGSRAVFEPVNTHHNSIASTAVKFHDLARLESPPARVSVVRDRQALGDLIGVLSQASAVLELRASKESYIDHARAA